jgi:hypothetical protein
MADRPVRFGVIGIGTTQELATSFELPQLEAAVHTRPVTEGERRWP